MPQFSVKLGLMPFHAQCSYCGQKSRVPDHMLGASGKCPKCTSFFTLVPVEEALVPGSSPQPGGLPNLFPSAPPTPSPPVPEPEASAAFVPGTQPLPPPKKTKQPLDLRISEDACQPEKQPWIEPIAACALLVGGVALLCTLSYTLAVGVIWLGLVSLFLGLVSLLRVFAEGKFHPALPVAGLVVGGGVFLVALVFPSLLGPTYLASRSKIQVDPTIIRVIPLSGKQSSEPESPEWVDAGKSALQQGSLRVQVVSVTIGPVETKPSPKKKGPPEERLYLRLRTRQGLEANEAPAPGPTPPGAENARPKLTDNTGKEYTQQEVRVVTPEEQGRKTFPMAMVDKVYVYEVPPTGLQYLHLEIPAEPLGGTGFFRFTIPSFMIRHDQPGIIPAGGLGGLPNVR